MAIEFLTKEEAEAKVKKIADNRKNIFCPLARDFCKVSCASYVGSYIMEALDYCKNRLSMSDKEIKIMKKKGIEDRYVIMYDRCENKMVTGGAEEYYEYIQKL